MSISRLLLYTTHFSSSHNSSSFLTASLPFFILSVVTMANVPITSHVDFTGMMTILEAPSVTAVRTVLRFRALCDGPAREDIPSLQFLGESEYFVTYYNKFAQFFEPNQAIMVNGTFAIEETVDSEPPQRFLRADWIAPFVLLLCHSSLSSANVCASLKFPWKPCGRSVL